MRRYTIEVNHKSYTIDVQELTANQFYVMVDGKEYEVILAEGSDLAEATITPHIAPRSQSPRAYSPPSYDDLPPQPPSPELPLPPRPALESEGFRDRITAPMPGTVIAVHVTPGQMVERSAPVVTLEAMKMKNVIKAPNGGVVTEVLVAPGQSVGYGEVLARLGDS